MAHAYTPGLRVTGQTTIDKMRRLPLKGDVVTTVGTVLKAEDVVARTALPGNVKTVNVANQLGVPPADVPSCMLKGEGDAVTEGEAIAQSKSLFGLFKSTAKSTVTGTIESVSSVTGQVALREPAIPVEIDAYVDGTVREALPGEGVVMETQGALIQGIFGIGGEGVGTLTMVVSSPDAVATVKDIGDLQGKIAVVGAQATYDVIMEAKKKGAVAVVAGGIADADLRRILGFDLGVAITGGEDLGVTVIVTEGFGKLAIAGRTFNLLKALEGKKASVNGATQIRAGVMRPEIIVPHQDASIAVATEDAFAKGLDKGMVIRVIREPYFGRLGEVTDLPPELAVMESGTRVRVLKVKFDDGVEAVVPRANVEMIEG